MKKVVIALFFLLVFTNSYTLGQNYTIIVSLDGFRWDYPDIHDSPNIDSIGQDGVQAIMRPSYPSSTFPNHYTLITGLVPNHHGIVNNLFWDRKNNRQYAIKDSITRNNPDYYKGKTIWATAEEQGVKTGSLYWIGSDILINNMHPTYYKKWEDEPRLTFAERVDTALVWLNKPIEDRPCLITLYMEEPDGSGHRSGPLGDETHSTVQYVDSLMGVLRKGIAQLSFADSINLIVTSDHGMTDVSSERFVSIDDYLSPNSYTRIVGNNPSSIFVEDNNIDYVYDVLSHLDHISVYRKNDIPSSLNYGTNDNIGDLIVIADLGWQFGIKAGKSKGAHGYPVDNKDMQVIFKAVGPDFKKNFIGKTFDNTAIYPLLCYLLRIEPANNDGKLEQILQFLQTKNQ